MDKDRYQAELSLLSRKLPSNAFRFFNMEATGDTEQYLRIGARTNSGNVYTLHMVLNGFPYSQPKVFVTRMLKDAKGNDMNSASGSMHTLTAERGLDKDLPLRLLLLDTCRFSLQSLCKVPPMA